MQEENNNTWVIWTNNNSSNNNNRISKVLFCVSPAIIDLPFEMILLKIIEPFFFIEGWGQIHLSSPF